MDSDVKAGRRKLIDSVPRIRVCGENMLHVRTKVRELKCDKPLRYKGLYAIPARYCSVGLWCCLVRHVWAGTSATK